MPHNLKFDKNDKTPKEEAFIVNDYTRLIKKEYIRFIIFLFINYVRIYNKIN